MGAAAGSPAHSRLVEEHGRLTPVGELTDELDYVARVSRQATPGSSVLVRRRPVLVVRETAATTSPSSAT